MKNLKLICMALLAMVAMASCSKGGNANVSSSTLTIKDKDWKWELFYKDADNNERGQYSVEINYPAINANVFNNGAVLVYMDVEGAWSQLPLTYYYYDDDAGFIAEASIEVSTLDDGGVALFWTQSDYWKVKPDTHKFKIVVIEGNAYANRADVNYSSYEAVKAAYQLAD